MCIAWLLRSALRGAECGAILFRGRASLPLSLADGFASLRHLAALAPILGRLSCARSGSFSGLASRMAWLRVLVLPRSITAGRRCAEVLRVVLNESRAKDCERAMSDKSRRADGYAILLQLLDLGGSCFGGARSFLRRHSPYCHADREERTPHLPRVRLRAEDVHGLQTSRLRSTVLAFSLPKDQQGLEQCIALACLFISGPHLTRFRSHPARWKSFACMQRRPCLVRV